MVDFRISLNLTGGFDKGTHDLLDYGDPYAATAPISWLLLVVAGELVYFSKRWKVGCVGDCDIREEKRTLVMTFGAGVSEWTWR